ncbi:MAG: M48 family metalloprotease [Holosporales bacterium]|jgi:predicted Zn-dependent protease|nr:M48 family metalloprotease [Holosporales bacterium]
MIAELAKAAGLKEKAIRIYVLGTSEINAAATRDGRVFLNSGLILHCKSVDQVRGVLAHEVGHIVAHHGVRIDELSRNLSTTFWATVFLGTIAGVAGRPDIGIGTVMGGQSMMAHAFLSHSQKEEAAADVQAVRILKKLGYSPQGLMDFLALIQKQERFMEGDLPAYWRTHPGTKERMERLREQFSEGSRSRSSQEDQDYLRIKEKIFALLEPLDRVLRTTGNRDTFTRALALYRRGDLSEALAILERLITLKKDPYLLELKAQILLEQKETRLSIAVYREALGMFPQPDQAPLIQLSLAHALLESGDAPSLEEATTLLNGLVIKENDNHQLWHLLAVAYGRKGDVGRAALALAEEAWALGHVKRARQKAFQAQKQLPKGAAGHARARDLMKLADEVLARGKGTP